MLVAEDTEVKLKWQSWYCGKLYFGSHTVTDTEDNILSG